MITPTAAWSRAFAADNVDIRFLVVLTIGTIEFKAVNGYCSQLEYPAAVQGVSNLAAEIDLFTKQQEVAEFSIAYDATWLRPIIIANRVRGMRVDVYMGAADLAEVDFESVPYFGGRVVPVEIDDELTISLVSLDTLAVLEQAKFPRSQQWVMQHPLELMLEIAFRAGLFSIMADLPAFDISNYTDTTSHWNVGLPLADYGLLTSTASGEQNIFYSLDASKATASVYLLGLAQLLSGHYGITEQGKFTFRPFDPSAAAVLHLAETDYDEFRQVELEGSLRNRVSVEFGGGGEVYQFDDTASQASYAFPGNPEQIFSEAISTPWLNAAAALDPPIDDTIETVVIHGNGVMRFCGAIVPTLWPIAAQDGDRKVSAARPAYIRIDDEFMKVTTLVLDTDSYVIYNTFVEGAIYPEGRKPIKATLTVERGSLGSVKAAHKGVYDDWHGGDPVFAVVDYTIAIAMARTMGVRHANGLHKISLVTTCDKVRAQVADFITIDNTQFAAYGMDGIDNSDKWEITAKEVQIDGSPPGVSLICVSAGTVANTEDHVGWSRIARHQVDRRSDAARREEVGQAAFVAGYTMAVPGSGLTGTLTSGLISTVHTRAFLHEDISITFGASKDSYVSVDVLTGMPIVRAVANLAPAPDLGFGETLAIKVVTDATDIMSPIYDLRQTRPIRIDRIATEAFSVYLQGTFVTQSGGGWIKLLYDTVDYDHGDNYDTAKKEYSAPSPLVLRVQAKADVLAVPTGKTVQLAIYVNGSPVVYGGLGSNVVGAPMTMTAIIVAEVNLTAIDDTVEIYIECSNGAPLTVDTGFQTVFAGTRIY